MAKRTRKYLGKQVHKAIDSLDCIPFSGDVTSVTLHCGEFTSLCPHTKQPDFAKLMIIYTPDRDLVETKSMKLFLWRYREQGKFNEAIVSEIADLFFAQIQPLNVEVVGMFNSRGGISVEARATRAK